METKFIILIVLILIGVFIYSFDLLRFTAFKIEDVLKWINKIWWGSMFKVNQFFNNGYTRFGLGVCIIGMLLYSMFFMFGVMS